MSSIHFNHIERAINSLPDSSDDQWELKSILRDIVEELRRLDAIIEEIPE